MMVSRKLLTECPHCGSAFLHRFKDEFLTLPLSDEQKEYLKKIEANDGANGILMSYS